MLLFFPCDMYMHSDLGDAPERPALPGKGWYYYFGRPILYTYYYHYYSIYSSIIIVSLFRKTLLYTPRDYCITISEDSIVLLFRKILLYTPSQRPILYTTTTQRGWCIEAFVSILAQSQSQLLLQHPVSVRRFPSVHSLVCYIIV